MKKLIELAHQWKIIFNPDPRNQSTENYLSKKQNQDSTFPLQFNDNTVQTIEVHKHFVLLLDIKLDFKVHIDNKVTSSKSLSILCNSLLTTYKMFIWPHLDYADIMYDKRVQCNACLAIIVAFKGTTRDYIYAELCLEPLSAKRWYGK